jgi:DNA repair exonuclease SbcCD ATPase subunit
MRIEKLEIENFRGFKGKHTVEFQSNVNVFVGV